MHYNERPNGTGCYGLTSAGEIQGRARMNITFVSAELAPLVKVGGLADVVPALSTALRRRKENPSVILPFYASIDTDRFEVRDIGIRVTVWMDGSMHEGSIWEHRYKGVPVYLIKNDALFGRTGIYGDGGSDYPDNAFRFAFLARAALEAAKALELRPDVFHINDWQTALLPVYQKLFYQDEAEVGHTAVVLSIHNLAFQGIYGADYLQRLGLPPGILHMDGVEFYGNLSFLKGGIVFSDQLTTVSPTYAKEIQSPKLGAGLDGLLRARTDDLAGILNGIDYSIWNPSKDEHLFARYDVAHPEGKSLNKQRLQGLLGLEVSAKTPLAGCIARLDAQKGFDILLEIAPQILSEGIQIVLLGSGRKEYLDAFNTLKDTFPAAVSVNEGFREELAPRIYAGSDLFLMPSRFEPCGLGQMIALRYGTIPIVRRTGGLADTIVDFDYDPRRGNGFVFERYQGQAFFDAVRRAQTRFREPQTWKTLIKRAMRTDFSWKHSADRYKEVYERAVKKRRNT
jgi:starch synthase